jgi:putative tryptophan/tyrosine transport system substrate-binding protein
MNIKRVALTAIAALWLATPLLAGAQPASKVSRIGVLWPNPPDLFDPVRQGLAELGYVEGRNIAFEYRWAQDKLDQLPQLAAELVQQKVALLGRADQVIE